MLLKHRFPAAAFALLAIGAACDGKRDAIPKGSGTAVQTTKSLPTLQLSDLELSIEKIADDARGVPAQIRVTFRNKSSAPGAFPIPRPVFLGHDDYDSLPCLFVVMQSGGDDDIGRSGATFLQTIRLAKGSPWPKAAAPLDAGSAYAHEYDLAEFCVIGHGIAPKLEANFQACYQAGEKTSEMRAFYVTDWNKLTRIESKPISVRTSDVDFSVREKLGDE